ncbi:elongation factor P hydroxylase [Marinomonas algarum]|uniref:Elongation factor P hydroxylase n=1 Tax=Marinomonas algarum TaxID=2883105 RepID=A0A9X1LBD3_9GAMM|nr:elongation factor P hydroxylase [Marinomonas algarum]
MIASQLVSAFHACFFSRYHTCLIGGAEEPLYLPIQSSEPAKLFFRADYVSSALHECSHWCVAGKERRLLEDYGYWYEPDTRDVLTQQAFEKVEVVPQAVECVLHWSAGLMFRVSVDNLSLADYDASHFQAAVYTQVKKYLDHDSLPERAKIFATYLLSLRHPDYPLNEYLKQQYEHNCR